MNDFEPKHIHKASLHLHERISECKKRKQQAYVVEDKKDSFIRHLINLFIKR